MNDEERNRIFKKQVEKQIRDIGYKGCRNCKHQIEPFRSCEWAEHDYHLHFICPKWEMKSYERRTL